LSASAESWSRPADARRATLVVLAALAVFVGSWLVLHHGFYSRTLIIDTPTYQDYGDRMAHGEVPYRDFAVEYPPGALPIFVLPSLLRQKQGDLPGYRRGFEALMLLCGAGVLACMALVLRAVGATPRRAAATLLFAALAPLALGTVILSRFDLWPALLSVAALAALVSGRSRLGCAALGLAVAAKVYPVVLLPLALAYVWKSEGRREALVGGAWCAGVVAACFAPFVALAPGGVWHSVTTQLTRPLQLESLGSSFLLAAHQVAGVHLTLDYSHGSENLAGSTAASFATFSSILQITALIAVWVWFARGPASADRLIRASAAAVCAFMAFGKVFSPQFMIWLLPLVPLVRGRRGLAASGVLGLALVLTQLWFPFRYWDLALHFAAVPSWIVLARDLAVVALLAVLLVPRREAGSRYGSA
jgi:hypothetical protein